MINNPTQLKIKLAEGATMPYKANPTDSGYDLTAFSVKYNEEKSYIEYGTGVFLNIPDGYEVELLPRSSISNYDLYLCNSIGLIDQEYNRELLLRFKTTFDYDVANLGKEGELWYTMDTTVQHPRKCYADIYKVGDKIGQMRMKKREDYELVQVDGLEDSGRGGFGSTNITFEQAAVIQDEARRDL